MRETGLEGYVCPPSEKLRFSISWLIFTFIVVNSAIPEVYLRILWENVCDLIPFLFCYGSVQPVESSLMISMIGREEKVNESFYSLSISGLKIYSLFNEN